VSSGARRSLCLSRSFGDDALGYFNCRLDPAPLRRALSSAALRAKRNKAFAKAPYIGLAIDGTGVGRCQARGCDLCHSVKDAEGTIHSHIHKLCMGALVGVGITLPLDIEPYGPGDSEYAAGGRLLERLVGNLGKRFADHAVVDGGFATAPFLHAANRLGLRVVARLKGNLPELFAAARARFEAEPPHREARINGERVELWDHGGFDPWETLRWKTVRVVRYRQHKPDGQVVEAYWLTDYPEQLADSVTIFRIAKSRWEIENQGFNEAKTYHGLEHITHHDPASLLSSWLILCLALTIERLYRCRFLRRGTHPPLTAVELLRQMRIQLGIDARERVRAEQILDDHAAVLAQRGDDLVRAVALPQSGELCAHRVLQTVGSRGGANG
jgi:hypothetical protein